MFIYDEPTNSDAVKTSFSMQILYVENHARFAKLTIAQFLSAHQVTVIPSVAAAQQALAQNVFDVVLVDYDLDDAKGDELVKWLQHKTDRPRVIAASAHQAGNDAIMAAGADAVCGKMQFSQIETVISQLLQR